MVLVYVLLGAFLLIGLLLWILKAVSTTYLDLYEKGLEALKKEDYKKASDFFIKTLKKKEDFTEAKYNLGLAYLGLEEYEKAREFFEEVLEETPDDFNTIFNLALVCQWDEDFDKALELYQKALFIDTQDIDCYLNISVIHFDKNEYEKALEYANLAKDISPSKIEILYTIARCKDEMCNYDKDAEVEPVLQAYEEILERNDLPEDFYFCLAKAYAKAGRITESAEQCYIAIEKDYFNDEAYRLLGVLQILKGEYDFARKTVNKAIEVEPDVPESYNILSYTFLGEKNIDEFNKIKLKYKNILTAAKNK